MTATAKLFGKLPYNLDKALIAALDASGTTITAVLLSDGYTFNQAHDSYNDFKTYEITGTGYTAGGMPLSGKTISYATRVTTFDADDVAWPSSGFTARSVALIYKNPAGDSDKKALYHLDFGENKIVSNGTFTIQWDSSGIFTHTVPA